MSNSAEKVYQVLRAKILSGELKQGAPLREQEVADLCGVSRTPVRDAMRQLEAEMFIWRSDSQRSFVAEWTLPDLEEVFTLRGLLESHAARRAAERADDEGIERLDRINSAMRSAVSQAVPDIDAFLATNSEFHAAMLDIAASERLKTFLNRLILQPIVQRTALRYDKAQLEQSLSEHEELATALRRRDPEWAGSVMTMHIRRAYHIYLDGTVGTAK